MNPDEKDPVFAAAGPGRHYETIREISPAVRSPVIQLQRPDVQDGFGTIPDAGLTGRRPSTGWMWPAEEMGRGCPEQCRIRDFLSQDTDAA